MNSSFDLSRSFGTESSATTSIAIQKAKTMSPNLALKLKEATSTSPLPTEDTPKLSFMNTSGSIRVKNLFESQRQSEKPLDTSYQSTLSSAGFEGSGPLANITNKSKTFSNFNQLKPPILSNEENAKKPHPLLPYNFTENARQDKRPQDKFNSQEASKTVDKSALNSAIEFLKSI